MADSISTPSPVDATYVEPSATDLPQPGTKIGDLFRWNMRQPYVLQRLSQRPWWVQSFNDGTVYYVGDQGVLVMDTRRGVRQHRPGDRLGDRQTDHGRRLPALRRRATSAAVLCSWRDNPRR